MSAGAAAVAVAVVAVMTYSMRASVIVALAGRAIPAPIERALRNVGPAVLAALVVNLAAGGEGAPSLEIAEAAALAVAGGVAWWRRNLVEMLVVGMVALWVVSWLT